MLQSASPVVAYNWFLYIVTISSTQATQTCSFLHSTTRTTLCLTRPCAHLTSALNHCTAQNTHTLHAEIYFPVHVLMPVWLVCEFGFLSTLSQLIIQPHPPQTICLFIRKQPGSYQSMGFSWHMYAGAVGLLFVCSTGVSIFQHLAAIAGDAKPLYRNSQVSPVVG